jgi:drug/metabolite transporter (DMT)-like permease
MRNGFIIVLIGFNVLWAGTYSVFKNLKEVLGPGELVTLRFGVAALLLGICWPWMRGVAPKGIDLLKTLAMGVIVFVVGPRLQVVSTQMGKAGDMSVLVGLEPLVTTLGAALLLHEKVPTRRWVGFCFGLAGAALLSNVWKPEFQLASLSANLLFVASFFCESAYSVLGKPLIDRYSYLKVITVALLGGMTVNLLLDGASTWDAAQDLPAKAWLQIIYLGSLCTAVGYTVWFAAIKVVPVNVVALTLFIQPVAGAAIAAVLLGEALHLGQLWGGLAIIIGLALGLRRAQPVKAGPETTGT